MLLGVQKVLLIYLSLLLFSISAVEAQPYYFRHYQVEHGLSNNAVMCSLQDHAGFMWFGTRDGLNRFDGLTFKVFRYNPDDSNSIGSNAINSIYEDDNNNIWVGTEKGLYRYDPSTEDFTKLEVSGNVSIRDVKVIDETVWYISLFTLFSYDQRTSALKTYKTKKEITAYCLMKEGALWIASASGTLGKYIPESDNFIEYDVFNKSPFAVSRWIESIHDTGKGILLLGTTNQGLKSFQLDDHSYKDILTLNSDNTDIIVRKIIHTTDDEYWIATQSGIYIYNLKSGKHIRLSQEQDDPYSLSDNIVHTLCMDLEGGIWAGTYFGGINYHPKQSLTFKKYFPKKSSNSISGYAVREISSDTQGNIWIGTEDAGLNKFNPLSNHFINFTPNSTTPSVSNANIHGLLIDGNKVWAGTYLYGLDVLDARTGKRIRHYNTENSSIGSNFIYSIHQTKSKEIIITTDKGLYQYQPGIDDFKLIDQVPTVFYRTLCEDRNGTIWVGTYGDGVFYYNTRTGIKGNFMYDADNNSSIASNLINDIFEAGNGVLWIATEGGLCRYTGKQGFERFTTQTGLPSNVTYSILEDRKKNLWISTSKGLVHLYPNTREIQVYTKSHGLLTDQFNYSSAFKTPEGQMYFGSVKGLISFYPDSIHTSTFAAPVLITGFQVNNRELTVDEEDSPLKNSITLTKSIVLSHNQSTFSIDFAALSFAAPDKNKYAYIMEGLDREWTHLKTNRKVYFTDLNPGTYIFKVKATSDHTVEGNTAELKIKIEPPTWRTWWAYLLYCIAVILLAYFIINHFIKRAKEKNRRKLERMEYEREKENYKNKMDFFTNVAHEIRTPLTLIKGPMENIMERAEEIPFIKSSLQIMNRNTDRLLELSKQLLDFRKIETESFRLHLSKEDVSKLLNDLFLNFKPAADQRKIAMTIQSPDQFYAYIDVEAFNKIISNLMDNAIKYAQSTVDISLSPIPGDAENYSILFKNDGYIIPPEMKELIFESFYRAKETNRLPGTGIGLTLSRSLAELQGGSLTLNTDIRDMNAFVLTLPLSPKQTL